MLFLEFIHIYYVCLEALRIFLSYEVYLLWQATALLRHSHLQAYVLKIHLKINSPRRGSLPAQWPETTYMKKTRFSEPKDVPYSTYREKRRSFSNDRTLNPSISGAEQDSLCSTLEIHDNPSYLTQRLQELSVQGIIEETAISKTVVAKASDISKSSRHTTARAGGPPKRSESVRFIRSLCVCVCVHMHWMMVACKFLQPTSLNLNNHFSVGDFYIAYWRFSFAIFTCIRGLSS